MDLIFAVLAIAFFLSCYGLVTLFGRLKGE